MNILWGGNLALTLTHLFAHEFDIFPQGSDNAKLCKKTLQILRSAKVFPGELFRVGARARAIERPANNQCTAGQTISASSHVRSQCHFDLWRHRSIWELNARAGIVPFNTAARAVLKRMCLFTFRPGDGIPSPGRNVKTHPHFVYIPSPGRNVKNASAFLYIPAPGRNAKKRFRP